MKNQTITPMAAPRTRTAVSFRLPAYLPATWLIETGHVSAGAVGAGAYRAHTGMSASLAPVVNADPQLRPAAVGTAKQGRPPRGIPR